MIDENIRGFLQIGLAVVLMILSSVGIRCSRKASAVHPMMFAGFVVMALECIVVIWKFVGRPITNNADVAVVSITGLALVFILLVLGTIYYKLWNQISGARI